MTLARSLILGLLPLLVLGCSSVQVADYEDFSPRLSMQEFFVGDLTAHGVVKNRSGRVIRTFNATIDASWENGEGLLEEKFVFDDGERQRRDWRLVPSGDDTFTGTAADVVGEGKLEVSGNSVFIDYVLRIALDDGTVDVRVDDRMYLVAPGVLINESEMSKFGVRVGSIQLVILRPDLLEAANP